MPTSLILLLPVRSVQQREDHVDDGAGAGADERRGHPGLRVLCERRPVRRAVASQRRAGVRVAAAHGSPGAGRLAGPT